MTEAKSAFHWRAPPDWIWRAIAFLLAVGVLVLITARWSRWESNSRRQTTDDAYLQADLTPIAAKVSGYVRAMPVQDFERVHAGQVIAAIVDDDYRAAVDQLTASVAAAAAQIEALKAQQELQTANVQAARASVASVTANIGQNSRDLARQQILLKTGSSATEAAEKLQTLKAQLAAQLEQARAQASAAARQLTVLAAQETQAQAALAAQKANLEIARINLGYTRIVAPQDGVIGQRQVKPGQWVGVGGQITSLTPLPNVWVIANYKETQLTHMAVGERAEVRVDTFPGHTLRGHVLAFAPGAGSQFALLPPDNATGNFTKVVQRIAVKIAIDDADGLVDRLLLKRRPDVRQADRRMAAATARIGVATADLYPKVTLKGLFGSVTSELGEFTSVDARTWGLGPSISWTFPNMAGPRARVRAAKANAAVALASFDSVVLQALKETEQALATYGSELDRRQALSEAQQRAHEAFDMAHDQFLAGSLSNLELLTTEQSLVAADAAVTSSDAALIQDQIAVFRALGGGWRGVQVASR